MDLRMAPPSIQSFASESLHNMATGGREGIPPQSFPCAPRRHFSHRGAPRKECAEPTLGGRVARFKVSCQRTLFSVADRKVTASFSQHIRRQFGMSTYVLAHVVKRNLQGAHS